jgi:hypothetical protein
VLDRLPTWVPIAAVVGVSALLRFVLALDVATPWITPDELVYALLGRNLFETGWLGILGDPVPFYSLVVPLVVGLPLVLGDTDTGYTVLKAVQAVAMSLAAVPVYLWGRELVSRGWALVAAVLTLAVPALAYSGLVMTEVVFYPVAVLAAWAMARALTDPTRRNQALLVGAIMLALATRLQAIVLLPALLSALGLKAVFDRSWRTPRQFAPTLIGIGAVAVVWAAYRVGTGGSLLAAYEAAGDSGYSVTSAVEFVLYHAGAVVVMTALVPVAAVVLLALDAFHGRETSDAVRAALAVAVSLVVWIVLEVGIFASEHVERLAERDLVAVLPVLFLGFVVWLSRGAPRPRLATTLTALVTAALVLLLPVEDFVVEEGLQDSFTLIPFYRLGEGGDIALYAGAAAAALLLALVPARLLAVLPAVVGGALFLASVIAADEVVERSELTQARLLGPDPRWVDRAADGDAAYLYDGELYWNAVWEHAFWNRTIAAVYNLPGAKVPGPLPQSHLELAEDGSLMLDGDPLSVPYVIGSTSITFFAPRIAETRQEGTTQAGLVLWRPGPGARLSTQTAGVRANGDIYGEATLTAWDCREGTFEVTLVNKGATRLEIKRDGAVVQESELAPDQTWSADIPASEPERPRAGGTCTFQVSSDGLLGSTRFRFRRPGEAD